MPNAFQDKVGYMHLCSHRGRTISRMFTRFSSRVTLNPQMWFGVEHIHASVLLVCDKHEKMSANFWKWTIKERERLKIKAKDFEGYSYARETS